MSNLNMAGALNNLKGRVTYWCKRIGVEKAIFLPSLDGKQDLDLSNELNMFYSCFNAHNFY